MNRGGGQKVKNYWRHIVAFFFSCVWTGENKIKIKQKKIIIIIIINNIYSWNCEQRKCEEQLCKNNNCFFLWLNNRWVVILFDFRVHFLNCYCWLYAGDVKYLVGGRRMDFVFSIFFGPYKHERNGNFPFNNILLRNQIFMAENYFSAVFFCSKIHT